MAIEIFVSPATISALDRRSKAVRAAIKNGKDRRRVLQQIKTAQNARWSANLASEGGEYGGWAGLANSTIEDRVRRGFGAGPILERTGAMFSTVRSQAAGAHLNAASVVWNLSDAGGTFAATHWQGFVTPTGGAAPSRKVWDFDGEDEDRDEELIADFFEDLLNGI